MRSLCLLCLLVQAVAASGQQVIVYTSPLRILSIGECPSVNLGFQFDLSDQTSILSEIGVFTDVDFQQQQKRQGGFYVREEYKRKRTWENERTSTYMGFGVEFGNMHFIRTDTIDFVGQDPYQTDYEIKRMYTGAFAGLGMEYWWKSRICLDLFLGLGVRINSVQMDITTEEAKARDMGDWNNPLYLALRKGLTPIPKFHGGFRIGYRFGAKRIE